MERHQPAKRTRRGFVWTALALPGMLGLVLRGGQKANAQAQTLPPTPSCAEKDEATLSQMEGPYYKRNSPQRTSLLAPGITGTKVVIAGSVLSTDCRPIARALVDFWQADAQGVYDNAGHKLRGHQFTDEAGRYSLETVVPGLYPGRTRHVHVKVQAPNQPILTTQLYFPDEPSNARDGLFNPHLLMMVQDTNEGKAAMFNFVLESHPRRTRARSEQG
jgi:protocatechuate 3,4-dioxygenase beta subunit